jgi:hypothetical protein
VAASEIRSDSILLGLSILPRAPSPTCARFCGPSKEKSRAFAGYRDTLGLRHAIRCVNIPQIEEPVSRQSFGGHLAQRASALSAASEGKALTGSATRRKTTDRSAPSSTPARQPPEDVDPGSDRTVKDPGVFHSRRNDGACATHRLQDCARALDQVHFSGDARRRCATLEPRMSRSTRIVTR